MLKIYQNILQTDDLDPFYRPKSSIEVFDLELSIDLKNFNTTFSKVKKTRELTKHDAVLSSLLYEAVIQSELRQNYISDLRLWQWIALNPLREYVLWRWDIETDELNQKANRFLGSGGVGGFSNNSASRLFFPVAALKTDPDAKSLIEHFWSNTQIELSISQSILSLNPKIVIAATRATQGIGSSNVTDAVNDVMVSLNLSSGSTLLDIMEEDEITALMEHE